MTEETVTIDGTEVTVRETDDGYEAEEYEPTITEQFEDEVIATGDSIDYGTVDAIKGFEDGIIRVYVIDANIDVVSSEVFAPAREHGWNIVAVEFEAEYIEFERADEQD